MPRTPWFWVSLAYDRGKEELMLIQPAAGAKSHRAEMNIDTRQVCQREEKIGKKKRKTENSSKPA